MVDQKLAETRDEALWERQPLSLACTQLLPHSDQLTGRSTIGTFVLAFPFCQVVFLAFVQLIMNGWICFGFWGPDMRRLEYF